MEIKEIDDPYKILNVNRNASLRKIKENYYRLSKAFHPDKHPNHLNELS